MKISHWLMTIFLISGIFTASFGILGGLAGEDAHNVSSILDDEDYSDSFDKIEDMNRVVEHTREQIDDITSERDPSFWTGVVDFFSITKSVVVGGLGLTTGAIEVSQELITSFSDSIVGEGNSGAVVNNIIYGILIIGLFFAIIEVLSKVRG